MKRIVVCDTGPLLHLSEAGFIHLLQNTGRILIPESVTKEFNQNAQGWSPPQWIEVHDNGLRPPTMKKTADQYDRRSFSRSQAILFIVLVICRTDR